MTEVHDHRPINKNDHPALKIVKQEHANCISELKRHVELHDQQLDQASQTQTTIKIYQDLTDYWGRQIEALSDEGEADGPT